MIYLQWLKRRVRRMDISVKLSQFNICYIDACDCSTLDSATHVFPSYPVVSVISFLLQGSKVKKNVILRGQNN